MPAPTATVSPTASPTLPPGAVSIRLSPSEVTANPGDFVDLDIVIEATARDFNGAQAYLSFPAGALEVVPYDAGAGKWIWPGNSLPEEIGEANRADNAAGRASYAAVAFDTTVIGSAVLGSVRFRAGTPGSHSISFQFEPGNAAGTPMRYTRVTGLDGTDLLQGRATGTVVHVTAPVATATQVATPTSTAIPAATPTGTAIPTTAPVFTAEPTVEATGTPEATATEFPMATSQPIVPVVPTDVPVAPVILAPIQVAQPTSTVTIAVTPVTANPPGGLPGLSEGSFVGLLPAQAGTGVMNATLEDSPVEIRVPSSGDRGLAILFQPLPSEAGLQSHAQGTVVLAFRLGVYSYDSATNSVEKRGDETSGPVGLDIVITDRLWKSCEGNPGRLALFSLADEWENAGSLERVATYYDGSPWNPAAPVGIADPASATYGTLHASFESRSVFRLVVLPSPDTDERFFRETGFRIGKDSFWDYFNRRGGVRTFGYPISREFLFRGFQVQFFQRAVLQSTPEGGVTLMNLLDTGLLPYSRMNSSAFPSPDPDLIVSAPSPLEPDYGARAIAFIAANVPDRWNGIDVGFLRAFSSTVRYEDAFPTGGGDVGLLPLLNLEIWGLPTSRPAYDPSNHNFVYQRFQRGILHYDASTGVAQGLLLADYVKAVITGENLPADLDSQAMGSALYRQYDRGSPVWIARPEDLPETNLMGAFEPGP